MTNNTDTKASSQRWEGYSRTVVLGIALIGAGVVGVISAIVDPISSHTESPASSVAASAASEPRPAMWDVRAQSYGENVDDVGNLRGAHVMRAVVNNLECPDGQLLRCCHAEVYFDGQLDPAETRTLCEELPVSFLQSLDGQLGSSSAALRSYADNRRFDQLYQRHYGHGPNDRNLYIMYSNDH